jgi:hypothetical protein
MFFFQLCEVSGLAIFHERIWPNLAKAQGQVENFKIPPIIW